MKFVAIPRQITACLSSYNYRYGAGSEFGREQREEARRKKYGINVKKYRPDDQPWILSAAGKSGKKWVSSTFLKTIIISVWSISYCFLFVDDSVVIPEDARLVDVFDNVCAKKEVVSVNMNINKVIVFKRSKSEAKENYGISVVLYVGITRNFIILILNTSLKTIPSSMTSDLMFQVQGN